MLLQFEKKMKLVIFSTNVIGYWSCMLENPLQIHNNYNKIHLLLSFCCYIINWKLKYMTVKMDINFYLATHETTKISQPTKEFLWNMIQIDNWFLFCVYPSCSYHYENILDFFTHERILVSMTTFKTSSYNHNIFLNVLWINQYK